MVGIKYLVRISYRKAVGDLATLVIRSSSVRVGIVMCFFLKFHIVLWTLARYKLFMDASLDVRKSNRCLNLCMENMVFELNLIVRGTACYRVM